MSALARYFNGRGMQVFGYDKTKTNLTKKLVKEGMKIHYDDDVNQIPENIDLVVYTPAIPKDHKELNYFLDNEFPVKKRAEVLGIISRGMQTIAIAGTHGKTTTTSILTHLLKVGKLDCTAFLGGIARNFESNFVEGKSDWVVVEADEYDRSFLHLSPDKAVILSMDADHLDIYGDENSVHDSFKAFTKKVKRDGQVFLKDGLKLNFTKEDFDTMPNRRIDFESFGIEDGLYRAENIRIENGYFVFDFKSPKEDIKNILFTLPGRHNVENATAAISIAQQLGISGEAVRQAMASFKGIKRRFEFIYRDENVVYIDDYAHHPSELNAAIEAAKSLFKQSKITGVFQPHLYSRTRDFVDGFAEALDQLDEVLLMDIYPARELPIKGVSSQLIFDKMKNPNKVLVSKNTLMDTLENKKPSVLLTLGAGDIDTFVDPIKRMLSNEK